MRPLEENVAEEEENEEFEEVEPNWERLDFEFSDQKSLPFFWRTTLIALATVIARFCVCFFVLQKETPDSFDVMVIALSIAISVYSHNLFSPCLMLSVVFEDPAIRRFVIDAFDATWVVPLAGFAVCISILTFSLTEGSRLWVLCHLASICSSLYAASLSEIHLVFPFAISFAICAYQCVRARFVSYHDGNFKKTLFLMQFTVVALASLWICLSRFSTNQSCIDFNFRLVLKEVQKIDPVIHVSILILATFSIIASTRPDWLFILISSFATVFSPTDGGDNEFEQSDYAMNFILPIYIALVMMVSSLRLETEADRRYSHEWPSLWSYVPSIASIFYFYPKIQHNLV